MKKKIRILVVGDSHTHAIKQALEGRKSRTVSAQLDIQAYRYSKIKNDREIGDLSTENLLETVASLDPQDMVVSTIGGNQHQVVSLVQHPIPFNLYLPDDTEPVELGSDSVIPYAQLRDYFERGLRRNDGARLEQLRAAAKCNVYHLTPPPPKEDTAHILKRHESDFAKAGLLEKGVSPAPLRLKVWRLQIDVLRQLAVEWGITLLPPPDGTLSSGGFLDPAYYSNDATHANATYGELVLQQLKKIALGRQTPGRA